MNPIIWKKDHLLLLDQRLLPHEETFFICKRLADVEIAIREMVVRGAPAIGVTAAYGLVLAIQEDPSYFPKACEILFNARPTAVNLRDAIDYMKAQLKDAFSGSSVAELAEQAAVAYHEDDLKKNRAIGRHGASFLEGERRILTHCNTGSLATSGWGTALGIVREIHSQGRLVEVVADETRPFLQGARLTIWECLQDKIPARMVTDGMGAHLMSRGMVDSVIVGADRIAANGDAANKIGTSMLAMAAKHYDIPFLVAAPTTTIDQTCPNGAHIPIEERPAEEVTHVRGQQIVPDGTLVYNPAFDVTPCELITAIVTEEGVHRFPYDFK